MNSTCECVPEPERCKICGREFKGGVYPIYQGCEYCTRCALDLCDEKAAKPGVDVWKVVCQHCHRFTEIRKADAAKVFGFKEEK